MRKEHFLPVYIRLDVLDRTDPLIDQVKLALQNEIETDRVDAPPLNGGSLWQYLHRPGLEFWSERNQLLTPLFVFDQFEEVFTLGAENQDAIARLRIDLADLIENRMPSSLAEKMRENEDSAATLSLDNQRYRVLLSFREEYLAQVENWKRDLPSLLRNRLRLLPMSGQQAFEAVYTTAPHLVDEALARRIVHFVAAAQDQGTGASSTAEGELSELELEPVMLSLVCHGLNERRKVEKKPKFDDALLSGGTGQAIISDYYQNTVKGLREQVQRFIAEQLITERGFRKPCDLDDAQRVHSVTKEELDLLVDRRVVRIEPWRGTERVELIYDLLTRVVREDRDRQRARKGARRRQQRVVVFAALGTAALVAVFVVFYMLSLKEISRLEVTLAEQRALVAQQKTAIAQSLLSDQVAKELPKSAEFKPSASCRQVSTAPRIYVNIQSEGQRRDATRVAEQLSKNCFAILGIQLLLIGPPATELRYFRLAEQITAIRAGEIIGQALDKEQIVLEKQSVHLVYIKGYEQSTSIRPGHLELWFGPS